MSSHRSALLSVVIVLGITLLACSDDAVNTAATIGSGGDASGGAGGAGGEVAVGGAGGESTLSVTTATVEVDETGGEIEIAAGGVMTLLRVVVPPDVLDPGETAELTLVRTSPDVPDEFPELNGADELFGIELAVTSTSSWAIHRGPWRPRRRKRAS